MSGSYRAGSVLPIHLRSFCWGTDDGRKVCEKENRMNEKENRMNEKILRFICIYEP